MKTKFIKAITLCLALLMCVTCAVPASAAEYKDATINVDAECSLTIWKFDWTNAVKDGVWNEDSFVSTGWRESYVEEVLGNTIRKGDSNGDPDNTLGNGQNSNGYAIKGAEFTIVRVADVVTFTESANDQHPDYNLTQVLYGFNKEASANLRQTHRHIFRYLILRCNRVSEEKAASGSYCGFRNGFVSFP